MLRFLSKRGRVLLTVVAGFVILGGAVPALAAAAAPATSSPAAAAASPPAGSIHLWTNPVPIKAGTVLKAGTTVDPTAIDCAGTGDCAATGSATPVNTAVSDLNSEPFVDSESNGVWQQPQQITGFTGLAGKDDPVIPDTVSCASPGNCVAGGEYTPGGDVPAVREPFRPFLAVETNGKWGPAQTVPGIAALNTENDGSISSVSCTKPGYCTAAGFYGIPYPGGVDATLTESFTVEQIAGKWQTARPIPVPKTTGASPFTGGGAVLSCTSPGDCTVGFSGGTSSYSTFVLSETKSKWGPEHVVKGIASLSAIDCASAGNCAMVGGNAVAKSSGGVWSAAKVVGGSTMELSQVSCGSNGNCLAGGYVSNRAFTSSQAAIVPETNGNWGAPSALSSVTAKSAGGAAGITTLSCDAAQQCEVGGSYTVGSEFGASSGFVEEVDHMSQDPVQTFSSGGVGLISCTAAGSCGGLVAGSPINTQVNSYADFTQKLLVKTSTALALSAAKTTYGKEKSEKVSVSVGPAAPVTPTGKVRVTAGKAVLCTITLKSAKGGCVLAAKQLKPGSYTLVATYVGDVNRKSSVSPGRKLAVLK